MRIATWNDFDGARRRGVQREKRDGERRTRTTHEQIRRTGFARKERRIRRSGHPGLATSSKAIVSASRFLTRDVGDRAIYYAQLHLGHCFSCDVEDRVRACAAAEDGRYGFRCHGRLFVLARTWRDKHAGTRFSIRQHAVLLQPRASWSREQPAF